MLSSGVETALRVACLLLGVVSCAPETKVLPPVGEVLIVVDTDMPVPRFVSRLRIDVYTEGRVWYESRDVSRARPDEWPTSFGLYIASPETEQKALVRLRAYPEGELRDYRGERYAARPGPAAPFAVAALPPATGTPRLLRSDGTDA